MRLKVSVPQVLTRMSNLKKKDGTPEVEQTVLLHVEGRLAPIETTVLVRGPAPYDVGEYEVDGGSFSPSRYGVDFRLRLGARVEAKPLTKAA